MIQAEGLVKTFHTKAGRKKTVVTAVDGVDLSVAPGEIVGFLGPNGAGKTTTLRMLVTLLKPTSGRAVIAGHDVAKHPERVRRSIGYVSQAGGAFSQAVAGDEVSDHGQLYGMSRADAVARGQELFQQLELDGLWQRKTKDMSGGQKRRLHIAMGLVHDPSLIFLDEPTTGLDPQARANLWTHIRNVRDRLGATVFLTTHYLDEADALSDRIVIIDKGKIVASDTASNLKAAVAGDLVDLEVAPGDVATAARLLEPLCPAVTVAGDHVTGRVRQSGRAMPALLRSLDAEGVSLLSLEVQRPTLDDVFLDLTGRSLRDAEMGADATDADALDETPGKGL